MEFHNDDLTIYLLCVINIRLLSNTHFRSEGFYYIALNECINAKGVVPCKGQLIADIVAVSYTHLRAHETDSYLVCRLLLEKKKNTRKHTNNKKKKTRYDRHHETNSNIT